MMWWFMIARSEIAEKEALLYAAKLMVAAARTAPKAVGRDNIEGSDSYRGR